MAYLPVNFITLPQRRLIRGVCIIFGMFLIGYSYIQTLDHSNTPKTLWVIDNSLSMTVTDIKTSSDRIISRLDLAKTIIKQKSDKILGEQAIMTAAQGARLELPMTDDRLAIENVVQGITAVERWGWSSFSLPIETIRLIYGDTQHLRIIWITDGEFSDSGLTLTGFTNNPNISLIWVGTRMGWPMLLRYDTDGRPKYKESEWSRVNSSRDDAILSWISKTLSAEFIMLESDNPGDIDKINTQATWSMVRLSFYMVFWVFLIIIGLLYPRYQYLPNSPNWK